MIGLIGGTGLGEALFGEAHAREVELETPWGRPSSPIRIVKWHGLEIAMLARHGPGHIFNPTHVPYRANIYALKTLGVTHVIASGAVGSLRDEIRPRDLVIPDQVIDNTVRREPTFFDQGVVVHVELASPYCDRLRERLLGLSSKVLTKIHAGGTYVCMEGPAFSTRAESHLHRTWEADLIGMTTMPEARLAREAEMCYALIALATDYDCWKPHQPGTSKQALLAEIVGHLREATANAVGLMRAAIADFATTPPDACECQQALELAIWSDRTRIAPATARRYGPLLSKYLPQPG